MTKIETTTEDILEGMSALIKGWRKSEEQAEFETPIVLETIFFPGADDTLILGRKKQKEKYLTKKADFGVEFGLVYTTATGDAWGGTQSSFWKAELYDLADLSRPRAICSVTYVYHAGRKEFYRLIQIGNGDGKQGLYFDDFQSARTFCEAATRFIQGLCQAIHITIDRGD